MFNFLKCCLFVLLAINILSACKKASKEKTTQEKIPLKAVADNQPVSLGKKLKNNPFSIETMRKALANIRGNQNRSGKENGTLGVLPPTHYYYRITPQSVDDIIQLENLGYEIEDVPLDQEIENEGDYYQDPSIPDGQITYLYTVLPVGYTLPSNINATLLQELYLFDEDAGDEADEDPWAPQYHCYEYNNVGVPYEIVCDENYTGCVDCPWRVSVTRRKNYNRIKEATEYLKSIGINPMDLYNEAMKNTGNEDEMISTSNRIASSTGVQRYHPAGNLRYEDRNGTSVIPLPLRGVTVKARRWFKLASTTTDGTGHFYIGVGYRKKATVLAKFKNDYVTAKGHQRCFESMAVCISG